MCAKSFLVRLGAPSRSVGKHEIAILDVGRMSEQLMIPGEAINVYLHDAQIGNGGAEVRVHHGAEMAIEIMRRDIDLESFRRGRNLHGLPHAVPRSVDDCDIDRLLAEIRKEFTEGQQCLARRYGMRALSSDIAERLGIETVNLDPEHVEIFDRSQDLEIAFSLGIEVEVEQYVDIWSSALADHLQMYP